MQPLFSNKKVADYYGLTLSVTEVLIAFFCRCEYCTGTFVQCA